MMIPLKKAFEQVLSKHSNIDVLVNNAGVTGFGLLEAYTLEQVRSMFETNFMAYSGLTRLYYLLCAKRRMV